MTGRLRGTLGRRRLELKGYDRSFLTWFQLGKDAMRKTIFALTIFFLAPSAAMASAPSGELVGGSELGAAAAAILKSQIAPADGVAIGQPGFSGGKVILAQGDMSGRGPGAGGQKGQKKGGHKGKQEKGKDNPGKGKAKGR